MMANMLCRRSQLKPSPAAAAGPAPNVPDRKTEDVYWNMKTGSRTNTPCARSPRQPHRAVHHRRGERQEGENMVIVVQREMARRTLSRARKKSR